MAGEYIPGQPGIHAITNDSRTATRGPNGLRDDWMERERLKREVAADLGQLALDIAGIIDPTPISDGTSALISLARGRWTDALISAVSIFPYIGDISKIGKLGRYSNSIRQAILLARVDLEWGVHLKRLFIKLKKPLDTLLAVGADKLPDRSRRYLQQMRDEIDRFLGPQRALRQPASKSPGMQQGGGGPGKTGPGPKKPKKTGGSLRSQEKTDTINDAGGGAKNKTLDIPQGLSKAQFDDLSKAVKSKANELGLGDDIFVQGSRANGTAKATSDIDIAIRVSPAKFDDFLANQSKLGEVNPGSAKARTLEHAIGTGKIQAGEARLSPLRKQLEKELGMEVDLSVIKAGGKFDNGSQLSLNK